MSLLKYVDRLKRMDSLIRRKATGTPEKFAEKLGICKSMLMMNLNEMKRMGAPIKYDMLEQTYFYDQSCKLRCEFEISSKEMTQLRGGRGGAFNLSDSLEIKNRRNIFDSDNIGTGRPIFMPVGL